MGLLNTVTVIWFDVHRISDFHLSSFSREDVEDFYFESGLAVSNETVPIS